MSSTIIPSSRCPQCAALRFAGQDDCPVCGWKVPPVLPIGAPTKAIIPPKDLGWYDQFKWWLALRQAAAQSQAQARRDQRLPPAHSTLGERGGGTPRFWRKKTFNEKYHMSPLTHGKLERGWRDGRLREGVGFSLARGEGQRNLRSRTPDGTSAPHCHAGARHFPRRVAGEKPRKHESPIWRRSYE